MPQQQTDTGNVATATEAAAIVPSRYVSSAEWLTIGEAAAIVGVCTKTLRRWEAAGYFPADFRTPGRHRRYALPRVLALRRGTVLPPYASTTYDDPPPSTTSCSCTHNLYIRGLKPATTTTDCHTTTTCGNAQCQCQCYENVHKTNHPIYDPITTGGGMTGTTRTRKTDKGKHAAVVTATASASVATPGRSVPVPVSVPPQNKPPVAVVYGRVSGNSQKNDLHRQLEGLQQRATADGYYVAHVYKDIASGLNPLRSGLKRLLRYCYVHRERITRVYVTYPDRLARFSPQLLVWLLKTLWGIEVVFTRPDGTQPMSEEQELVEDLNFSYTRLERTSAGLGSFSRGLTAAKYGQFTEQLAHALQLRYGVATAGRIVSVNPRSTGLCPLDDEHTVDLGALQYDATQQQYVFHAHAAPTTAFYCHDDQYYYDRDDAAAGYLLVRYYRRYFTLS